MRLVADLAAGDKLTPGTSGNDGGTVVLGQTWDTRTIVPIEPFGSVASGGGTWQQPRDKPKLAWLLLAGDGEKRKGSPVALHGISDSLG